ncbi:SDR family NAD(P)-dependent oxidoreductase [Wolbachia endosymbiont of Cruorifilaria tuberocauda]|uniref:SDR family oxidoreductase n=1 Tax=Wolbachia endosymbiont of Cruorifilaria tuberocauda TaxID=1812111 RepID=UPI00158B7A2A|nr:SDR family oxidoreductase [Wolbachia endosymbiont of Cruorifilaria tuberocauda]QKX01750.1 SDR family NAD(P)-dependent oxidoreductase [Wolbachia endosymbiont of Cruorifilaria tuberocauda]
MYLFCFGYGYVAKFLSKNLLDLNWKIGGTSRDKNMQDINLFNYDNVDKSAFHGVTHILVSIPPGGDDVLERYGHYFQDIKWLGYLSATNVYGDHAGNWVTEESETRPVESRGKNRLKAEKKWLDSKLPVHIFRLSGIYGPSRNVLIDLKFNKARNVRKKGHLFSRIHVSDVSNILFSSMQNKKPGEIYNCADDLPATQSEVVAYAARLLNISVPKLVEISSLPNYVQSFYLGSKKVSNFKIKKDLNISLIYPSYKIGLKKLHFEETNYSQ